MLTFEFAWDVGVDPVVPSLTFEFAWDVGVGAKFAALPVVFPQAGPVPGLVGLPIAFPQAAPAASVAVPIVFDQAAPAPGKVTLPIAFPQKVVKPSVALPIVFPMAGLPKPKVALPIAFPMASTNQGHVALPIVFSHAAPTVTQTAVERIEQWDVRVVLDGVDVSDRCEGRFTVNAEEGAARVAEVTLEQFGAYDPEAYINRGIEIDGRRIGAIAGAGAWHRQFTGHVDEPILALGGRSVKLVCSDGLQRNLEPRDHAQIAAITGGLWHRGVFREDADGWEYAQDRMSTQPANIELSRHGTLVVTPWAAKATPDFTCTQDDIPDDTIKVDVAKARNLHNVAKVSARVRFDRRWERQIRAGWVYPRSFSDYLSRFTTLPTKQMIRAALSRTGWATTAIAWRELPDSGTYWVGPPYTQSIWQKDDSESLRGFAAVLGKRWIQTVDHAGELVLRAPGSIARYGSEIPKVSEAQYAVANDDDPWPELPSLADESPDPDADDRLLDTYVIRDSSRIILGEGYSYGDVVDEADLSAFYECILAIAKTEMLAVHRQSEVTFVMPYEPEMDRDKTIRLNHREVVCQGKVRQYEHALDEKGGIWTTVDLAISRGDPTAEVESAFIAPASPPPVSLAVDTAAYFGESINDFTQLGGLLSAPPYDPDAAGYSGNYILSAVSQIDQPVLDENGVQIINPDDGQPLTNTVSLNPRNVFEPGSEEYPVGYYQKNPEIPAELTDSIDIPRPGDYTVSIPTDELTILAAETAP